MNIEVRPKRMASIFNPPAEWACISVVTEKDNWPEFLKSQPTKILRLYFADVDNSGECPDYLRLFNEDMAKEILDFYSEIQGKVAYLLVHCEAGWSRSPAIAAAISKILYNEDGYWFRSYSPNRHVYRLILNEAHARGLI